MVQVTVVSDEVRTVDADVDGERIAVATRDLRAAIGWELKPQGLCRGDICVPVADRLSVTDDRVELGEVAAALGRPIVIDGAAGIAALALDREARRQALQSLDAPSFTLKDLDGRAHQLEEWRGRKKLLVAFSSW